MTDRDLVELDLLGPALEAAVAVAAARPTDAAAPSAPPGLRPYLRFRALPAAARVRVRAVLEADDDFRGHVGELADPDAVGLPGTWWLTRPEGWEDHFAGAVDEAVARAAADEADEAERSARRRIPRLEEAVSRAEERAAAAELDRDAARRELAEGEAARAEAAAERTLLVDEIGRLTEERRRAVRELKETESHLQARIGEVRRLREERDRHAGAEAAGAGPAGVDTAVLGALVRRALDGLDAVDASLGELADLVGDVTDDGGTRPDEAPAPRRRPLRVGRGLDERSPEGARWLLDRPGVVVVVDGYNLTMTVWPELELGAQREQVVRALAGLAGRTGASFEVVFDGDDVVGPSLSEPGVVVRFTPADVEADDEVIERVATVPADTPVVVVSDDRRVRDGARRGGANVVGSEQLRTLLMA